jgi:putative DNA primase/helicase
MSEAGRHPSLFHDSHTGKNTSISKGLLHCWRHNVSHNAISSLAVMAGLYDCVDAGTGHKFSNSGSSCIDYSDGETIFEIWKYAKDQGYLSKNDPIPTNAMVYFALKNDLCKPEHVRDGWKLPTVVYNLTIDVLWMYSIESGRKKIQERRSGF